MVRQWRIDFDGADAFELLRNVQSSTSSDSMGDFLRGRAFNHLRQRAIERFKNEGDDASGKWLPLKASTMQIRMMAGFPAAHPINRRTGELRSYVTMARPDVTNSGGGAVLTFPGHARGGEVEEKFVTAQIGNPNNKDYPGAYTPPRPVAAVSVRDLIALQRESLEHIFFRAGMR